MCVYVCDLVCMHIYLLLLVKMFTCMSQVYVFTCAGMAVAMILKCVYAWKYAFVFV